MEVSGLENEGFEFICWSGSQEWICETDDMKSRTVLSSSKTALKVKTVVIHLPLRHWKHLWFVEKAADWQTRTKKRFLR